MIRSNHALRRWLAQEVLGKKIPKKPARRASGLSNQPWRSYRYRAWIKSLPSAVSGLTPCDPCHTGPHAYGQRAGDDTCIPLTRAEHDEYDADPEAFCARYGLDVPALTHRLRRAWFQSFRQGA